MSETNRFVISQNLISNIMDVSSFFSVLNISIFITSIITKLEEKFSYIIS